MDELCTKHIGCHVMVVDSVLYHPLPPIWGGGDGGGGGVVIIFLLQEKQDQLVRLKY